MMVISTFSASVLGVDVPFLGPFQRVSFSFREQLLSLAGRGTLEWDSRIIWGNKPVPLVAERHR